MANVASVVDDGVEFDIVWSGKDELLPPRATIPDLTWEPPPRLYNKREAPVVVIGERSATPTKSEVVEEIMMTEAQFKALTEALGSLQVQNEAILERLDDLETKIDNLNLYQNDGYGEEGM